MCKFNRAVSVFRSDQMNAREVSRSAPTHSAQALRSKGPRIQSASVSPCPSSSFLSLCGKIPSYAKDTSSPPSANERHATPEAASRRSRPQRPGRTARHVPMRDSSAVNISSSVRVTPGFRYSRSAFGVRRACGRPVAPCRSRAASRSSASKSRIRANGSGSAGKPTTSTRSPGSILRLEPP